MDTRTLTNIALASRVGFGVASWVAPQATFRPFGVKLAPDASVRYVTRLFGARDVALGALGLISSGDARRGLLATLCAADVVDGVAALAAGRKGDVSKVAAAALVLGGLVVLVPQFNELRAT